jgi:hypothetical protein
MYRYKIATLAFVALFARGCDSQIVVDKVPPGQAVPANGVIYTLPNTVARVQVKVDKATAQGAPYSPFAAVFAPDGDPVCKYEAINETEYKKCLEGITTYAVQQGATFAPYGEPDPDQVFLVRFMGKGTIDQSLSMTWNETGILTAASSSVTNRTGDIILSGLKMVTGLGIKLALGAPSATLSPADCGDDSIDQDTWIVPELAKAGSNSSALIGNYCGIKKEDRKKFPAATATAIQFTNEMSVLITKTFKQLLEEAVQTYAAQLDELVKARTTILQGKSQTFEPASLLSHIESEINQKLTSLYLGTKKTLTWEGSLDVRDFDTLAAADLDNQTTGGLLDVIHVDEHTGICLKVPLAPDSKPIPKKFNILTATCNAAPAVQLRVNFFPASSSQLFTRIAPVTDGIQSFRYRVPAQVRATLCDSKISGGKAVCDDDKKTYGSGIFSVAQLGKVISLPATRHSKTLSYELTLIDSTGGLKTFKLGTAGGLDPATIEALGGIAGSLIEARQKGDEINQLTRQQQLLKLQDEICTIQKKYGLPCSVQPE